MKRALRYRCRKYPWDLMDVGDYFCVDVVAENVTAETLRRHCHVMSNRKGKRFSLRRGVGSEYLISRIY